MNKIDTTEASSSLWHFTVTCIDSDRIKTKAYASSLHLEQFQLNSNLLLKFCDYETHSFLLWKNVKKKKRQRISSNENTQI